MNFLWSGVCVSPSRRIDRDTDSYVDKSKIVVRLVCHMFYTFVVVLILKVVTTNVVVSYIRHTSGIQLRCVTAAGVFPRQSAGFVCYSRGNVRI